jgi:hypothetical protein
VRIYIIGDPSTWAAPRVWPGFTPNEGPWHYKNIPVAFAANAFQDIYYEISLFNHNQLNPHQVAYLDSFDPTDPSANFLGDYGATPTAGNTTTFQVIVPMGRSLLLHFVERGDDDFPATFDYEVHAFSDALRNEDFTTGVPEPSTWALAIAGFGLAGASIRRQRRAGAAAA